MATSTGEMPFLDHLEELRQRIFWVLGAIVVGVGLGLWLVLHFNLVVELAKPIAPYIPGGKLTLHSPTESVMVVMKLGIALGLVLASPVIIWQLWGFLSPALYQKEKKAIIPTLVAGLGLFLCGAWLGWRYAVPMTLKFLLTWLGNDAFNNQITFDYYFSFLVQSTLALGLCFELPLVMILLAAFGVMDAKRYHAIRRYAVVVSFIAGAFLSPGADVLTMLLYTAPLLILYEVGVLGSYLAQRKGRKRVAEAAMFLVVLGGLLATPARSAAQVPRPVGGSVLEARPPDTIPRGRAPGGRVVDSATAKRLGLPTGPVRKFPEPDSLMQALLGREGFAVTRYLSDSARMVSDSNWIDLRGRAATVRDSATLEAEEIRYDDGQGMVFAKGEPKLFQGTDILIGRTITFNTEKDAEKAILRDALTSFDELGANWFVRGNLQVDSTAKRLWAGSSEFTTCDLPIAHYHFEARQVKWVAQSVLVARPAVLYIRDVPVMWLPFLFQDTKAGRRSGILIPQFGLNDIVRPSRSYNRQVTNIGYYWAPNDYLDVTGRLDWYANRFIRYGGEVRYRWLDRFVRGGLGIDQTRESDGLTSITARWDHQQNFSAATSLNLTANYVGNTRVLQNNSVDPLLSTQQISSDANFTRRFRWGTVNIGATRRQTVSDGSGSMTLPSLAITPAQLRLGPATWSPTLSFTNVTTFKTPIPTVPLLGPGSVDSLVRTGSTRTTNLAIATPFNIAGFNWRNNVKVFDQVSRHRRVISALVPDLETPDPNDSIRITTIRGGDYYGTIDWDTGIDLPSLFKGTWKLTPSLGITNIAAGPLLVRTPGSNGQWVMQGKKPQFALQSIPVFYGFLNKGFGPVARTRYKFAPTFQVQYSPAATLSQEFIDAMTGAGITGLRAKTPATTLASFSLSQNLEVKLKRSAADSAAADTTGGKLASASATPERQPISVLTLTTSSIGYDFEQAKEPGRTGWVTPALTNSLQSQLVPGFQLSLTHDLWKGRVGYDTATFEPFLSNVQANLALSSSTFRSIGALFGLASKGPTRTNAPPPLTPVGPRRFRPGAFSSFDAAAPTGGRGLTASLTWSLSRQRPTGGATVVDPVDPNDPFGSIPIILPGLSTTQSSIGLNTSFSPTAFWSVTWSTQYNATLGRFESQQVQLTRDLHDWRAQFNFVKNANGNYALYFSVFLLSLPDLKFDYNQTTLRP
ncbi:MAG: twin-arginine translocase subunit TatC [Gemmatimonadetes bacterium]|nr:twin-arginine translocase subunit TatC [Gemmatimonadota bacterium]